MFDALIFSVVFAVMGWAIYKSGKSEGSRKGYNVGRSRGRRWR